MIYRIIAGVVAAALVLIYMAPVVLRLQEVALWAVTVIGAGMMLVDLWQSLFSRDD